MLEAGGRRVLVDCGFPARRTQELLEAVGTGIGEIDAVFVTHEHGDHAGGLSSVAKRRPGLEVYASEGTVRALRPTADGSIRWRVFAAGDRFSCGGLEVESFPVPHDAADPVGFLFHAEAGDLVSPRRTVAWVTDLGYAPELVRRRIREADALVLEANHDAEMLRADVKRPWSVKQRISGRHGHLSNEAAVEVLATAERPRWRHVLLTHLSRDCNSVETVLRRCACFLVPGNPFSLSVVAPGGSSPLLDLT